ncbi:MAG: TonB-dependent receptor [Xanthomonadales bacterium]|nr:TonB-dependent receptor [Xanthomonadales bacterium]
MVHNDKNNPANPRRTISVAISAAVAGVPVAQAQDESLEEIIVTATKRELSLQDTPISVTAFSDEQITLQRFTNFNDYVGQIPGLALSERQPGANSVIMRGCAAQGLSFSDSATTSVYLDEQPITAAGYNPDPRLIDIARVEALAGPQGTLFGDAAQCGTLRIITNKPDTTESSGWIDLTGSSVADGGTGADVSGMVNIPLADNRAAVRLVGFYADEAGWVDNILSPSPGLTTNNADRVRDDVNSSTWSGGRASLRFQPNDEWTVDFSGIYQKYELDGFGDASLNQQFYADTSVFPRFNGRQQARFNEDSWEDEWYQFAVTAEGDLSFGNVVVTASYFDRDSAYFTDATAYMQAFQQLGDYFRSFNTGDPYYDTGGIYDFGGDPIATNFDARQSTNWTIEARYATPAEGKWSGIVGGFYNHREVNELFISNVEGMTGTPGFYYINYAGYYLNGIPPKASSNNFFTGTYDTELDQWAVFGEVTANLTENFSITAGGRYYSIENDYTVVNAQLVGLNGGIPDCAIDYCLAPGDLGQSDESGFVPKVNLTYTASDDRLFYATYSEGFRRGGANSARPQSVFGPPTSQFSAPAGTLNEYESDTVKNFEIGAKTDWLDGRLRFNLSLYHMVWEDIQIQAEDPQDGIFTLGIVNFPEAEIDGFEAWLSWLPSDNWTIDATLGYNDGELSRSDTLFPGTDGEVTVPVGTPLPIVPDVKANLNLTYSIPTKLWGGDPYFLARFTHTGESINSLAGIESIEFSSPILEQDSWQTLDLQFGVETDKWTVSAFIDNVTDEEAQLFFNNRWAQTRLSVNQPRTIGVNFRYRFSN